MISFEGRHVVAFLQLYCCIEVKGCVMDRTTRTVMLVGESTTLRYYYGILLKRLDYEVLTAASAEDALTILERTVPSLIITEFTQPLMSGKEFIRMIKGAERTKALPIIVFVDDLATRTACRNLACVGCLVKPVDPALFYRTIQAAVEPYPREHIRLSLSLKVLVGDGTADGGAERMEYATKISEGGLYLRTLYPKPKNALTPVKVFIRDRMITAKATVLYRYSLEDGVFREPGMGLKFIEISDDDRSFVRTFIREELTSDIMIST